MKYCITMLSLLLLGVLLTTICTVSEVFDDQCFDNCKCCKDGNCGRRNYNWTNECFTGCIDGHRGGRCYQLCQYENCKSCGNTTNSRSCTDCYDGYYLGQNKTCTLKCPPNCKSCTSYTYCTECKENFYNENGLTACQNAYCPMNCECTSGQRECISCKKGFYDTSSSCNKKCPAHCLTCESKDSCNECKNGFYNGNEYDSSNTLLLNNCSYACRDNCTGCQSYNNCVKCITGKYGSTCQMDCSVGCLYGNCFSSSGYCTCATNFTGDKCSNCTNGTFGTYCNKTCSKFCKAALCEKTSGDCVVGCVSKNMTGNACNTCTEGTFDTLCNKECPENCKNNICEKYSGNCSEECTGNFRGAHCDLCIHGKYGKKCEQNCSSNCEGDICEKDAGTCYTCKGNYDGETCEECKVGYFGHNCESTCSQHCKNKICDKNSGKCIHGCTSGYSGDRCCVKSDFCVQCINDTECGKCASGYFNNSCNEKCLDDCLGSCDISTGECDVCPYNRFGKYCEYNCSDSCNFEEVIDERACARSDGKCTSCKNGFFSPTCNETCSNMCVGRTCSQDVGACSLIEGQTGEPPNLSGPIAGGVIALIVVVAGIFVVIYFYRRRRMLKYSGNESTFSGAYLSNRNSGRVETKKENNVYENMKGILETEHVDHADETRNDEEHSVNMSVKIEDLFSYVTKDRFDSFENEFKNLPKPDDLSSLCKIAKKAENIAFNRYNGIYPFDHSRVTIPGEQRFFINACYIDGYKKSKAYIASTGPTIKHTNKFRTFWRMVWYEKADVIVMLTNLREVSGMKCEQYWPEIETDQCYGSIEVICRSEEEFAEYTVRSFTISKIDDRRKENRNLTQLHFTAWPDKGVPSDVTSLVEFRQRVKSAPVVLDGPMIVHCSAGVGRTGTYIALDILSEQGQVENSLNVFTCVSKMRQQRVNMVQTAEQYIFLHKALVHTLTFESEAQTAEEIQSLPMDDDNTFVKMFQTLHQEVDIEREEDIVAREENKKNYADKFRHQSDIPGHRGRVRLYLQRKSGIHDVINAVYINSFKIKNFFIAAQTPMSNTVEDFLCMVYQQNTCCVVALEDPLQLSKNHDIGIYLPADNKTFKCGDFTVTSSKFENKTQYTMKKLTIKHTYEGEEKTVYHFQYKKWVNSRKVPDSPGNFVQFVKDIEKCIKQQKEDEPNVAVHCLNGNERSGLFCVVYTLLEKLEAERKVSVVNTVRKVRAQRKLAISSVKQLKFCYQCISAYLESYNTYTNFAV